MPLSGQVTTRSFDGGRDVSLYVPASPAQAVVWAGDGQLIATWGQHLEAAGTVPTAIVGVHRIEDEMARIGEYSPTIEPQRFAAHERFWFEQVAPWVDALLPPLPPERTAMAGVSASAELALARGLAHDRFGVVFAASPGGGFQPADAALPATLPRTYLTSGTLEPWFGQNADRWAHALTAAGGEVKRTIAAGDHGDAFWHEEFVRMVTWAFDVTDAGA